MVPSLSAYLSLSIVFGLWSSTLVHWFHLHIHSSTERSSRTLIEILWSSIIVRHQGQRVSSLLSFSLGLNFRCYRHVFFSVAILFCSCFMNLCCIIVMLICFLPNFYPKLIDAFLIWLNPCKYYNFLAVSNKKLIDKIEIVCFFYIVLPYLSIF